MKWLRLYYEILDDTKVSKMSDKEFRIWILLMCYASEVGNDGQIPSDGVQISWRIREKLDEVVSALNKLKELDILVKNNGNLQFKNWQKRQYKSDDSKERQKLSRVSRRCHGVVTPSEESRGDTDTEERRIDSNSNFVSNLKEIYTWIDVDTELVKMRGWLSTRKGRRLTQRFAVNWLNKIDKPIEVENKKSW